MLRQDNLEDRRLLDDDCLPEQKPPAVNFASVPLDVLALIVEWLPFESAIAFMLSHKRLLRLFDHPHKLNNYINHIPATGELPDHVVSFKDVNYILLQCYFRQPQLKQVVSSFPVRYEATESRSKRTGIVIGASVGCFLASMISLPVPIIACVSGPAACGGGNTIVGTSILGLFSGLTSGIRSGLGYYEGNMRELRDQQKKTVTGISSSLRVLLLENKTPLQLSSLFKANKMLRERSQQLLSDLAEGRPHSIKMRK